MRYLLVNHVPFFKSATPGQVRMGDMWLEDLRAQAKAIGDVGGRLVVAVPLTDASEAATSGSFNLIDARPEDHGFEHVPLVRYMSMKEYLLRRGTLRGQLADAIGRADVVQMGYGGHPVGLGQVAFPIATALGKKRIWNFDGADPFPRLERLADEMRNPAKRVVRRWMNRRFSDFCRIAIRTADMTWAHNAAVPARFSDVWNGKCHQFNRSFVTDAIILTEDEARVTEARLLDDARPLRLVVAGRQIRMKGTDQVIRALAQARQRGANLALDVLGDGDDLASFVALARELNVEPHVRFRGTVSYGRELFDAWAEADVMVVTNLTAEISRNVLLAAARGLPLITYANPGTDAMLKDADAAWIVPTGDVPALAESFTQAATERSRLVGLLHRARHLARSITLDETHRRRAELVAAMFRS